MVKLPDRAVLPELASTLNEKLALPAPVVLPKAMCSHESLLAADQAPRAPTMTLCDPAAGPTEMSEVASLTVAATACAEESRAPEGASMVSRQFFQAVSPS